MKQDYAKEDKEIKPMATITDKKGDREKIERTAGKILEQDKLENFCLRSPIIPRFD